MHRSVSWLALAILLVAGAPAAGSDAPGRSLRIDPAKTRVGMSKVKLQISEATIDDEKLEAVYRLSNLFLAPKHDAGTLHVELDQPLDRLLASGGSIMGRAYSAVSGKRHVVHCRFQPDGTMRIDFRIGTRLMTFETTYAVGG